MDHLTDERVIWETEGWRPDRPLRNPGHPVAVLKDAWRVVRLDTLRAAAEVALARLEELHEQDVQTQAAGPRAPSSATEAAWLACCHEIRDEAGLLSPTPQKPGSTVSRSSDWVRSYRGGLERYRDAAGAILTGLLDA
ncbi:MAG: hypothetical protein OEZ06_00685 [Myxococcales bacterium]|nr:hypothetical protein [Myxococcales bacterium]